MKMLFSVEGMSSFFLSIHISVSFSLAFTCSPLLFFLSTLVSSSFSYSFSPLSFSLIFITLLFYLPNFLPPSHTRSLSVSPDGPVQSYVASCLLFILYSSSPSILYLRPLFFRGPSYVYSSSILSFPIYPPAVVFPLPLPSRECTHFQI